MAMDLYILADKVSHRSFNNHWRNGIAINSSQQISSELSGQIAQFNHTFEDLLTKSDLQFTAGDHIRFLFWPNKGIAIYLNKLELLELAGEEFFPLLLSVWTGDVPLSSEIKNNINGTSGWHHAWLNQQQRPATQAPDLNTEIRPEISRLSAEIIDLLAQKQSIYSHMESAQLCPKLNAVLNVKYLSESTKLELCKALSDIKLLAQSSR
jgi:hypothetical protein